MLKSRIFWKSFITSFTAVSLVGLVSVLNSPIYTSQPEANITCIETNVIFTGGRAPAGCFTGDVFGENQFNLAATMKYQEVK
jgi:hypothetical protein